MQIACPGRGPGGIQLPPPLPQGLWAGQSHYIKQNVHPVPAEHVNGSRLAAAAGMTESKSTLPRSVPAQARAKNRSAAPGGDSRPTRTRRPRGAVEQSETGVSANKANGREDGGPSERANKARFSDNPDRTRTPPPLRGSTSEQSECQCVNGRGAGGDTETRQRGHHPRSVPAEGLATSQTATA